MIQRHITLDLNNQISRVTPISADYLLRDTLFQLLKDSDDDIFFSDYLSSLSGNNKKSLLSSLFPNFNNDNGRISITAFISLLINERVNVSDFKARTGINDNEKIQLGKLSVMIFHDLLTHRLISE